MGIVEKRRSCFPTIPTELGNRCGDYHIPPATATTDMNISGKTTNPGWGQFRRAKGAKSSRRNQPHRRRQALAQISAFLPFLAVSRRQFGAGSPGPCCRWVVDSDGGTLGTERNRPDKAGTGRERAGRRRTRNVECEAGWLDGGGSGACTTLSGIIALRLNNLHRDASRRSKGASRTLQFCFSCRAHTSSCGR
jgi:hypothetical protein